MTRRGQPGLEWQRTDPGGAVDAADDDKRPKVGDRRRLAHGGRERFNGKGWVDVKSNTCPDCGGDPDACPCDWAAEGKAHDAWMRAEDRGGGVAACCKCGVGAFVSAGYGWTDPGDWVCPQCKEER